MIRINQCKLNIHHTDKELGQEPAYQVQAVKYKYLKPLVESLEVQLNGKESVG